MAFTYGQAIDGFRLTLASADVSGWWGCAALAQPYGQRIEIEVSVFELDVLKAGRNMASITEEMSWEKLKAVLNVGDVVSGVVLKHEVFGVFVDIGCKFDGLIEIIAFRDEGVMTPEMYPAVGAIVRAKVLGFRDSNNQIWLSVKPGLLSRP